MGISPTHGGALVSFDAPVDSGGLAVTSYTVSAIKGTTATGGDIGLVTASGTASPVEITGLDSGTPYTVTLTATNTKGTSDPAWTSSADAAAIPGATLSSIDATANTVVLSSGDTTIVAGQKLRLLDRSGTTAAAISDAAISSIDAGTANSITLSSPDATIVAGQRLQLGDAGGNTCGAAPKGTDLTVLAVHGAVITFTTDLTAGDGSASTNCDLNRAGPCGATPKDSDLLVSTVSSDGSTIVFSTDITVGDSSASTQCVLGRAVPNGVTPDITPLVAPLITSVVASSSGQAPVYFDPPTQCVESRANTASCASWSYKVESYTGSISSSPSSTVTGSSSPIVVTGLTSSAVYRFKAYAVNTIAEESPPSSASAQITIS